MLGPVTPPYRHQKSFVKEGDAELSIEDTLEHNVGKKLSNFEPVFLERQWQPFGLVLLLDTSLSMKGEKLAFLAMTVAAVAFSVPAHTLAVFGFDTVVHELEDWSTSFTSKNRDEVKPQTTEQVYELVEKVLRIPPGGFTNIELALLRAQACIQQSGFSKAKIILVSDGKYTEGKDPARLVQEQDWEGISVHTVKIGKEPTGRNVMKELAQFTSGHFHEVREMSELPRVLLRAVRAWIS